jgi:hypothetical protein
VDTKVYAVTNRLSFSTINLPVGDTPSAIKNTFKQEFIKKPVVHTGKKKIYLSKSESVKKLAHRVISIHFMSKNFDPRTVITETDAL